MGLGLVERAAVHVLDLSDEQGARRGRVDRHRTTRRVAGHAGKGPARARDHAAVHERELLEGDLARPERQRQDLLQLGLHAEPLSEVDHVAERKQRAEVAVSVEDLGSVQVDRWVPGRLAHELPAQERGRDLVDRRHVETALDPQIGRGGEVRSTAREETAEHPAGHLLVGHRARSLRVPLHGCRPRRSCPPPAPGRTGRERPWGTGACPRRGWHAPAPSPPRRSPAGPRSRASCSGAPPAATTSTRAAPRCRNPSHKEARAGGRRPQDVDWTPGPRAPPAARAGSAPGRGARGWAARPPAGSAGGRTLRPHRPGGQARAARPAGPPC